MDNLNPILECSLWIEEELSRGKSPYDAALGWLNHAKRMSSHQFQFQSSYGSLFMNQFATLVRWLEEDRAIDLGNLSRIDSRSRELSRFRENMFQLLESGKRGAPILRDWRKLRQEIEMQIEVDLKGHIDALPFKMLIPLLLLMFPAFLILLFGPITQSLLSVL